MADVPPTTFNLNEDEKAILRRTLRVIALEPDRIEFAVKDGTGEWSAGWLTLAIFALMPPVVCSAIEASFHPFVNAIPLSLLSIVLALAIRPEHYLRRTCSLTLFPGTAWVFRRMSRPGARSRQLTSCELLTRLDPIKTAVHGETRFDTRLRLRTDVGAVILRRRRFDEGANRQCREVLATLVAECCRFPDPSRQVVSLAQAESIPLAMPRPAYRSLIDHLHLVSLSSHEITLGTGPTTWLPGLLMLLAWLYDLVAISFAALADVNPRIHLSKPLFLLGLAAFMLVLRLIVLVSARHPSRTIRLSRLERSVVATRAGRTERFDSSVCNVECRYISPPDSPSIWSVCLLVPSRGTRSAQRRARLLGELTMPSDVSCDVDASELGKNLWSDYLDKVGERGARNAASAFRYYLDHAIADDSMAPEAVEARP